MTQSINLSKICDNYNHIFNNSYSVVSDSANPWTCYQVPLSLEFSKKEVEWVAIPSPGHLPDPRIEPRSPTEQVDFFFFFFFLPFEPPGKPIRKSVKHSAMLDSSRSHGLQPARLVCPWNSPGQNLIHFNVWQNLLQYCKVISVQLIKKIKNKKKESACKGPGFNPWVGKIPWRREWMAIHSSNTVHGVARNQKQLSN